MTATKKPFVTWSVVCCSIMLAIIMVMDWSRLFLYPTTGVADEYPIARTLKLILSFMTLILAWGAGKESLNTRDRNFIRGAFVAVFFSDIAFRLDQGIAGAIIFTIAQVLFIIRHLGGIKAFVAGPLFPKYRIRLIALILGIAALDTAIVLLVFKPIMGTNPIFLPIVAYSAVLCCSMAAGITALAIGQFPRKNAVLIAIGAIGLFCCDLTVGLNMGLPHNVPYIITTSITWMFYAPALVLIGISGYQLSK